jgi:hypothetical protein
MKTNQKFLTLMLIFMLSLGLVAMPVLAQDTPPTERPLIYADAYETDFGINVDPWQVFLFSIYLKNNGNLLAKNVVLPI